MKKIWVVAADNSRARIFSVDSSENQLKEIQTLSHPESRLHEGDLISDTTEGEPEVHKHEEADRFALSLCSTLESGRKSGDFEKLYLVAAPAFLGHMRKHLSGQVNKVVAGEVDKNLATHSQGEIRCHLPKYL
jgi:protein required for attachment to host cells